MKGKLFGIILSTLLVGIVLMNWWGSQPGLPTAPSEGEQVVANGQAVANESTRATPPTPVVAGPFTAGTVSERSFQGAPAIAVSFTAPLDPGKLYDSYLDLRDSDNSRPDGGWVLSDNHRILYFTPAEPEKSYRLVINPGLPAADGRKLASSSEHELVTRRLESAFDFASRGSVLPARISQGLPIMTVNVPEVDIEFLRVRDDHLVKFVNDYLIDQEGYWYNEERGSERLERVYFGRFSTETRPNTRTITHIAVEEISALRRPGLYLAYMKLPGPNYYSADRSTFFHVSDIGLQLRLYPNGMFLHTASLSDGSVLKGVELTLFDREGETLTITRTDDEGNARFDQPAPVNGVVLAKHGEHIALLSLRQPALDLAEFPVVGNEQRAVEAFLFTGRDLYRPGERIELLALLRDYDGRSVADQPLHLRLLRPDGKLMGSSVLSSEGLGDYRRTLELPATAQTGRWRIEVRNDPAAEQPIGVLSVHVEEFLPERMRLDLTSEQNYLLAGEALHVAVQGDYLYGAPAAGNRLESVLNYAPEHFPLEALPGYYFGDADEDTQRGRIELEPAKLDAKGGYRLNVAAPDGQLNSPMSLRVSASLYESGGRPVTRSITRILWPDTALVGVRPRYEGDKAPANELVQFEYLYANADGTRGGINNLLATVIREDRDYYWSYSSGRGWHYEYTDTPYPVHEESLDIGANSLAVLTFPVEYGSYRIEIKDGQGRLLNRYRFNAGWNWSERMQAANARPDRVNMTLDQEHYKAGDTVRVTLVPPHPGNALITLESDHLLWQTQRYLPAEGAEVEIPLDPAWADRHDLYLGAVVLRAGDAINPITPNRAIGLVPIPLERTDRRLHVTLDLVEKSEPERPLPVKVHVEGATPGQEVRVVLAAIDLGILNITGYPTPHPADHFFAQRRYGVELYDIYGRVIESRDGVVGRLRFGGDMDLAREQAGKLAQAKVQLVALHSAPVTLDADGNAHIELAIPDFNGALRVMAVVYSADSYGAAEHEVKIAAPLVVQTSAPRFMAGGDKALFSLEMNNMSGRDLTVQIALDAEAPLQLQPVDIPLHLADGERRTLTFPMSALEGFDEGAVTLEIAGEGIAIKRQYPIVVRPAYPAQTRVLSRRLLQYDEVNLDSELAGGLIESTLRGRMSLSDSPDLALGEAFEDLLQYPYGCLEQTTSRAFPLLYDDDALLRAHGVEPLTRDERVERINKALTRLQGMQLNNGGFVLWGDGDEEEGWLSAYVVDFLLEAREQGFALPDDMLQKGLDRLHARLRKGGSLREHRHYSDDPRHLRIASEAYAAYVLARVGRAPLGTLRTLAKQRAGDAESGLPLLHLGLALKLTGDHKGAAPLLTKAFETHRKQRAYLGDYGTPLRDGALMVALVERHELPGRQVDHLLDSLSDQLAGKRWFSTQERLALYLAARALDADSGTPWQVVLREGALEQQIEGHKRRSLLDADTLGAGIGLRVTGSVPVYVSARVNGYPLTAPEPDNKRVVVERRLFDSEGELLDGRALRTGELIIAHLRISGSERNVPNALLEDLLPAGLEIENLNLTQGEGLEEMKIDGVWLADAMESAPLRHQEYRDDRYVAALNLRKGKKVDLFYLLRAVTPGEYRLPPPLISDMYRPQWRAVGQGAGRLVVEGLEP